MIVNVLLQIQFCLTNSYRFTVMDSMSVSWQGNYQTIAHKLGQYLDVLQEVESKQGSSLYYLPTDVSMDIFEILFCVRTFIFTWLIVCNWLSNLTL